jgi:hypothetical protein
MKLHAVGGARTIDGGHGRIDIRTLHVRAGPEFASVRWPGLAQICRLVHQTQRQARWHTEVHYKITSLPPERAGPADLLRLSRVHWAIENQLHYVRDVTLGEDASRIRSGAAPQAMAAMRNLVVAILHREGISDRLALLRVGVEQAGACLAVVAGGQFPRQVVGVGDAGVEAERAQG